MTTDDCPAWCTRAPADHYPAPEPDGRRYVRHSSTLTTSTGAAGGGPRLSRLSRVDVVDPDGTVVVGDVEVTPV